MLIFKLIFFVFGLPNFIDKFTLSISKEKILKKCIYNLRNKKFYWFLHLIKWSESTRVTE